MVGIEIANMGCQNLKQRSNRYAMGKPKVLLLGKIDHAAAKKAWDDLGDIAELVLPSASNPKEFVEQCERGDYDGVLAVYRTFDSIKITGRIEGDLVKALPKSLKFICHNGAGYDQINVPDCTDRGIFVSNVPEKVNDATADTAVYLMLGAMRNFPVSQKALRNGQWRGSPPPALGHDPEGKTLGILGMGGIGRNMARKLRAFDMKVQYYNRHRLPEKEEEGAIYVSFEELLKTSDVLSLNLPLNPHTEKIISTKEFEMMKPTAYLINTARGGVIDEAALVKALDEGKIAGAGLDVYEAEPKIQQGLVDNPKIELLPHMGTWTVETQTAMELHVIDNVRSALQEGKLITRVPEQAGLPY